MGMGQNNDPTGAVPAEDAEGRLVLTQTHALYAKSACAAFLAGCVALYSLVFWYKFLALHAAPPAADIRGRVLGVLSSCAWPVLLWMLLKLAWPPSLTIDAQGITARNLARLRRLSWEEMREIRLAEVTVGRGGQVQTQTMISGPDFRISWMPVYGVAPKALAKYVAARRRQARPTLPLEIVDTTPSRLDRSVHTAMAFTRTLHLALVVVLGAFALMMTLAVSFAVRGNTFAVLLFGPLMH